MAIKAQKIVALVLVTVALSVAAWAALVKLAARRAAMRDTIENLANVSTVHTPLNLKKYGSINARMDIAINHSVREHRIIFVEEPVFAAYDFAIIISDGGEADAPASGTLFVRYHGREHREETRSIMLDRRQFDVTFDEIKRISLDQLKDVSRCTDGTTIAFELRSNFDVISGDNHGLCVSNYRLMSLPVKRMLKDARPNFHG